MSAAGPRSPCRTSPATSNPTTMAPHLQASGTGSLLSLPNLASITLPNGYGEIISVEAYSGGDVELPALTQSTGNVVTWIPTAPPARSTRPAGLLHRRDDQRRRRHGQSARAEPMPMGRTSTSAVGRRSPCWTWPATSSPTTTASSSRPAGPVACSRCPTSPRQLAQRLWGDQFRGVLRRRCGATRPASDHRQSRLPPGYQQRHQHARRAAADLLHRRGTINDGGGTVNLPVLADANGSDIYATAGPRSACRTSPATSSPIIPASSSRPAGPAACSRCPTSPR